MKKITTILILFFMVGIFAAAQEFGSIKGTVNDGDGSAAKIPKIGRAHV